MSEFAWMPGATWLVEMSREELIAALSEADERIGVLEAALDGARQIHHGVLEIVHLGEDGAWYTEMAREAHLRVASA